jgi:hypothetical protein
MGGNNERLIASRLFFKKMKLYATIQSERATKGQGGNDYLNINIKDENEKVVWTIHCEKITKNRVILELFSIPNETIRLYHDIKSKRQKGE